MLTKILLTALVIVVVLVVARGRGEVRTRASRPDPIPLPDHPAWLPRALAAGVATLVLAGVGLWYFLGWQDDQRLYTIRVTDTRSGETVTYQARKGDIDGRRFRTLEGWEVRVSDLERVELVEN